MSKYTLYTSKLHMLFISYAYTSKLYVYISIENVYICMSYARVSPKCNKYVYKYINYVYGVSYEHVITHISRDPRPLVWENENENRVGFSFFNLSRN